MKWAIVLLLAAVAPAQPQATEAVNLTAKSANVGESVPIKINIFRWSTNDERTPIVTPLDPAAQAAAQAAAAAGGRGGRGGNAGNGGGRGGRGGGRGDQAAAAVDPDDPAMADVPTGRGGRGGGRGGRGGGDAAAPAKPPDPISLFAAALGKAPTIGYLWTNEVAGYSIKYAYRNPLPDGGERIILVTDRRLGGGTAGWKLANGTPTDYEFTLVEIRMDSKGSGEGKASLGSKIVLEMESKTVAIENYVAAPVILQNVKR